MFRCFGPDDYNAYQGVDQTPELPALIGTMQVLGWPEAELYEGPDNPSNVAVIIDRYGVTIQGANGYGRMCMDESGEPCDASYHMGMGIGKVLERIESARRRSTNVFKQPPSFSLLDGLGFEWHNFPFDNNTDDRLLSKFGMVISKGPSNIRQIKDSTETDQVNNEKLLFFCERAFRV